MRPSARVTDLHTCPMQTPATPAVPHVGGPVLPPGAPRVLVGSMPAARLSDMAICTGGPPDVIGQAASTVIFQGLFAARMTDTTVHGGLVVGGWPTVLIGGPTFTARPVQMVWSWSRREWQFQYGDSILIGTDPTDPTYQSRALAALVRLDSTTNGHNAIDALEGSGHTLTLIPYIPPAPNWGAFNAYTDPADPAGAQTPGTGSDSVIGWSPDVNGFAAPGTTPPSSQPGSDILLGHEMIHGVHNATGSHPSGPINAGGMNVGEERNTVGLPASTYNDPAGTNGPPANGTPLPDTTGLPYTENGIRGEYADRGTPSPVTGSPPVQRPSYYDPTPTDGPGAPF